MKFKTGDEVVVISSTYDWAFIRKGDVGIVDRIDKDHINGELIIVDFPNQKNWTGKPRDFILKSKYKWSFKEAVAEVKIKRSLI